MMHTPEQARELWCPMARVAQAGHTDIGAAYNRSITKMMVPVKFAAVRDPEQFALGQDPTEEPQTKMVMETAMATSMAANCIADKCAMWRWAPETGSKFDTSVTTTWAPGHRPGYCGLAGRPYAHTLP